MGALRALEEGADPPADAAALEAEWVAVGPNDERGPMQANLLILVESLLSYNVQRGARVLIERLRLSLASSPELAASVWGALVKPGATDKEKRAKIVEIIDAHDSGGGLDDDGGGDSDGVEVEAELDSDDGGGDTDSPEDGELDELGALGELGELPTFSRLPSPAIELPRSPPEKRARGDAGPSALSGGQ